MSQHFLLSAAARTLSLRDIYKGGEDKAYETFRKMRWSETDGEAQRSRNQMPSASSLSQMSILDRLVAAHKAGRADVPTGEVIEGTGVASPADAWPSASRKTVAGVYIENNRRGHWRLKTD